MNSKQLEIYIHIPFCVRKCDYCDFLSMSMDEGTKREYVNALVREIELSKEKMEGRVITSVFIGGGTPSILQENFITKMMEAVKNNCHLSDDAEITIECNPGTVTEAKLNSYKEAGINRISFGLQSANDQELKSIGRIHDFAKFKESYELARKVGFENINVDVMSALPGQTVESYKHTLESVLAMEPEHISAYSLIVEDGTPLQERVEEVKEAAHHDRKILVEETIVGREIECAVFGNGTEPVIASGVGEILAAADFYDFDAKYYNAESRTVVNPELPGDATERVRQAARRIFKAVDGYGLSRVDFFVTKDGEVIFNEINTMPGFTAISMYPMLFEAAGIPKPEMVTKLIEHGLKRYEA